MKIGFIVQKDWKKVHYGVRNYFTTIALTLEEENHVDYLIYDYQERGESMWYLYSSREYPIAARKTMRIDLNLEEEQFSYSNYKKDAIEMKSNSNYEQYVRCIGNSLEREKYDILIITNPWLINFREKLPAKKVIGLVYDLIANEFAITRETLDFEWAYLHNQGYLYYLRYCDVILAISEKVAEDFNLYYKSHKCDYIRSFFPYEYRNVEYTNVNKENAVVLAAPFDPRKGIQLIPDIINPVSTYIDTLYIYGAPRCDSTIFNEFFKRLSVKKVVYYPYITTDDLIELYMRCKILLFPSIEEGLGIPLIEAQVCGCRVVTSDKKPMNQLVVDGGYILGTSDDTKQITAMLLDEDYDYSHLSKLALKHFMLDSIKDSIVLEGLK